MSDQDRYPVTITTTQQYLVWIEADDQKDAVQTLQNDGEWYEHLTPDNRIDGAADYSIEAPEQWGWQVYVEAQGPRRGCTECGAVAHSVNWQPWHQDGCSQEPAEAVAAGGGS